MARGRSGVISKEYKGEENTAYHDVIKLFKIYRAVNWQMQIKINQVKRRFHMEYGTDVDEFLESIYQAFRSYYSVFKVRLGDVLQSPVSRNSDFHHMVGQNGLEPSTSRLSVVCSSQLSYWPMWWRLRESNP